MARTQGRAGAVTAMGSGAPGSASEVYEGVQGPGMQGSTSDDYDADQIDPADGAPEYVQILGTPSLCKLWGIIQHCVLSALLLCKHHCAMQNVS